MLGFWTAGLAFAAPAITKITPATGATQGGTLVTISGSGFGTSPSVSLGGAAMTVTGATDTTITATTPAGEGVGKQVIVIAAGQASNAATFNYLPPSITSISPTNADTAGGSLITLTGKNFGLAPTIGFNGSTVTPVGFSHTQAVFTLPPGEGTNLPVTVTAAGQSSGSIPFSYNAPFITSINPSSGPSQGGTVITITGGNFGLSATATLGGKTATPVAGGRSHNQLIVTVPPGEGFDQTVRVTVLGQMSNGADFDYDPPSITGISPSTGPTTGGTLITLTGTSFGITPRVRFNNSTLYPQSSSHSRVVFMLEEGEGSNLPVKVLAGYQESESVPFSYAAPVLTGISAASYPTAGGTTLTLTGSNFGLNPTVTIGGKPAPAVGLHTDIVCTLPAGGGSNKPVVVNAAGQLSNALFIDYDGDTFSSWSESIAWNGLDSTPGADPRHTGWKNSLAYALGVNPTTATGGEIASRDPHVHGMPSITRDPTGQLQVSFWRRRAAASPDLTYQVQFTSRFDPNAWEPPAPNPDVEVVDDTWEFCTFRDAGGSGTSRFGRLKVELAPQP